MGLELEKAALKIPHRRSKPPAIEKFRQLRVGIKRRDRTEEGEAGERRRSDGDPETIATREEQAASTSSVAVKKGWLVALFGGRKWFWIRGGGSGGSCDSTCESLACGPNLDPMSPPSESPPAKWPLRRRTWATATTEPTRRRACYTHAVVVASHLQVGRAGGRIVVGPAGKRRSSAGILSTREAWSIGDILRLNHLSVSRDLQTGQIICACQVIRIRQVQ